MKTSQDNPANSRAPVIAGLYFPQLDGIRGIAICLVLVFHCSAIATPQHFFETLYIKLANAGWAGVDLFFVLSGFLITGILLDTVAQPRYLRNFYTRRTLRIFPLYYTSIVLWMLANWLTPATLLGTYPPIANHAYWFYLQNCLPLFAIAAPQSIIHFWSLAVEEQFYLIWPLLIRFMAKRGKLKSLCAAAVLTAVVLRTIFVLLDAKESAFYFTLSRIDALVIGAYVAVLFRRHGTLLPCERTATHWLFISGSWLLLMMLQQRGFYNLNPLVLIFGVFPLALFFGCLLVLSLIAPASGLLRQLLQVCWLQWIGRISYGVYVVHWPIMLYLKTLWPSVEGNFWLHQITFLTIVTGISVTVAYISFHYFESPILKLKHKMAPLGSPLSLR